VVGSGSQDSFLEMQNSYYNAKQEGGGNFDMKRYQPVHGDKFRASTDEYE
jgi:hypothetical protein